MLCVVVDWVGILHHQCFRHCSLLVGNLRQNLEQAKKYLPKGPELVVYTLYRSKLTDIDWGGRGSGDWLRFDNLRNYSFVTGLVTIIRICIKDNNLLRFQNQLFTVQNLPVFIVLEVVTIVVDVISSSAKMTGFSMASIICSRVSPSSSRGIPSS